MGTTVRRAEGGEIYPEKMDHLAQGMLIYRNHDQAFLARLEKSQPVRKIGIQLRLEEVPEGFMLSAEDEDGNHASFALSHPKTQAQKPEQAAASCQKQLKSLGGTSFECTRVDIGFERPYFIPVAALNALRRGLVEKLEAARQQNRPRFSGGIKPNAVAFPEKRLDFTGNVLNEKARAFYTRHGVETIEPAAESGLDLHGRKVMTTRHCLKFELGACRKHGGKSSLVEPLTLLDEDGNRFKLHFDCSDCVMEIIY